MSPRPPLRLLPCAFVLLTLSGCAATLVAPPPPAQPRAVYLLDHGRHTSLVLTDADQQPVRYAYGEWRWYVDDRTGPIRALTALFRPTPAALGRMRLGADAGHAGFRNDVGSVIHDIVPLQAEAVAVDRLLHRLDRLFETHADTLHYSDTLNLEFVAHPEPYTLGNSSNHKVAEWLREMGFEIHGSPMLGRWRVAE